MWAFVFRKWLGKHQRCPRKLKEVSAVKDVRETIEQIQRTETKAPATEGSGVSLSSKLFQIFHASSWLGATPYQTSPKNLRILWPTFIFHTFANYSLVSFLFPKPSSPSCFNLNLVSCQESTPAASKIDKRRWSSHSLKSSGKKSCLHSGNKQWQICLCNPFKHKPTSVWSLNQSHPP